MVGGSKYEVLECHEIDGYHARRLRWSPGYEQWRCNCPEYLAIKPLTPKAWCKHCEQAAKLT